VFVAAGCGTTPREQLRGDGDSRTAVPSRVSSLAWCLLLAWACCCVEHCIGESAQRRPPLLLNGDEREVRGRQEGQRLELVLSKTAEVIDGGIALESVTMYDGSRQQMHSLSLWFVSPSACGL
jgi:hypothetical protein